MSSVFARLYAHMPSLCLSFTGGDKAFCPGGGGGGEVEVLVLGGGGGGGRPCLLCCLPSHFMAPSVHRQTVKW